MGSQKLLLVTLFLLAFASSAQGYDFFYFVQQWPGSYCNTNNQRCCYPIYGKPPSGFGIHGLWPNYNRPPYGAYPQNCYSNSIPIMSNRQVSGLVPNLQTNWPSWTCPRSDSSNFWQHEWTKHGTCSEAVLSQYDYFRVSLQFKQSTNILQCLITAGILPNGRYYTLASVTAAIEKCIRHTIYVKCNIDKWGHDQLYEVYTCINKSGTMLIDCPVLPTPTCLSFWIRFPSF
ncbi:hypothetical protein LUZ61_007309 [Rhynchospora tenuis]|uniref:Uncharacterized protein n=1 Tax=Rhynchospora tenuis TaxID=198213 RepID=A0AAD5ZTF7_9POAL|nr:hypothetical protein LUZ61_007309 [Rhynchospora tenuis]